MATVYVRPGVRSVVTVVLAPPKGKKDAITLSVPLAPGKAFRDTDDVVKQHDWAFTKDAPELPVVEQATANPGEGRQVRRP